MQTGLFTTPGNSASREEPAYTYTPTSYQPPGNSSRYATDYSAGRSTAADGPAAPNDDYDYYTPSNYNDEPETYSSATDYKAFSDSETRE